MTAEEYLKKNGMSNVGHYGLLITDPSKRKMHQIMEDYANIKAKYHVEAALKAASEKVNINAAKNTIDGILDAYPLDQIK